MFIRTNGSPPVLRLRDEIDRLFNGLIEGTLSEGPLQFVRRTTFPAVNLWEDGQNVYAEAELPGLRMEEVEVLVSGVELTLRGRRIEASAEGGTYHRRERGVGDFARILTLPVEVDAEKVQATLRDGVLTVTLPKAAAVLPRKIQVRS